MDYILEYVGMTLISVVAGGALLYAFLSAPDSGLATVGELAGQEVSDLGSIGAEQVYTKEEMDRQVTFSYEEKTYTAGIYENLAEQFSAEEPDGKQLPVRVLKVVSEEGEVCSSDEAGTVFPDEGVYQVYVTAAQSCYKVTVPVAS